MAGVVVLHLMVGLPAAGKTTTAKVLAAEHRALRLTPDEWMKPLFADSGTPAQRDLLEGRLITTALQVLRLGVDVVLDFGLWSLGERAALHHLAAGVGARCRSEYLPVDRETQWERARARSVTHAHETFPMSRSDLDTWRGWFEEPQAAELAGHLPALPEPPHATWAAWAVERWPTLALD